jgi:hypothetical protein
MRLPEFLHLLTMLLVESLDAVLLGIAELNTGETCHHARTHSPAAGAASTTTAFWAAESTATTSAATAVDHAIRNTSRAQRIPARRAQRIHSTSAGCIENSATRTASLRGRYGRGTRDERETECGNRHETTHFPSSRNVTPVRRSQSWTSRTFRR